MKASIIIALLLLIGAAVAGPLEESISKSECYRTKKDSRYYPNRKWTKLDENCVERLLVRKKVRVRDLIEYDKQRRIAACIYLRFAKTSLECNVLHEVHPIAVKIPMQLRAKNYRMVNPKALLKICKAQYTTQRCNEVCKMKLACAFPKTDERDKSCRKQELLVRDKYGEIFLFKAKAAEQGSLDKICVPPKPRTSMRKSY